MSWVTHYLPPSLTNWQGRLDSPAASCFFQLIKMLDLREEIPSHHRHLAFALLGFRCDEGIRRNLGRIGAAEGPLALRAALSRLPVHRTHFTCYDAGDITCLDQDLEAAQSALGDTIALLLAHHIVPIVIGGGHEIAWGHFQGLAKQHLSSHLSIVNFDAHLDMRPLLDQNMGSSGTPFLQIAKSYDDPTSFDYHCIGVQPAGNTNALLDTAKNYHTHVIYADDLQQPDGPFIQTLIQHNKSMYISVCLDVFASAYAPGVSAPQSLGLTPWQIIPLLRKLSESGKIISYDIAELSPRFDIDDRTAKLAANLIYDMIHHHKENT